MTVRIRQGNNSKQRTIDNITSLQAAATHSTLTPQSNGDIQIRSRNHAFQMEPLLFPKQTSNGSLERQISPQLKEHLNYSLIHKGQHEQIQQREQIDSYLPVPPPARPQKGKEGFIRFRGKQQQQQQQQNSSDFKDSTGYEDIAGGRLEKRMKILKEGIHNNSFIGREQEETAEKYRRNKIKNSSTNNPNQLFVRHLSSGSRKPQESSSKNSQRVITGRDALHELRTLRRKTSLSVGDHSQIQSKRTTGEDGLPVQAGSAILPRGESYLFEQFKASSDRHSQSILEQQQQQNRQFSSVIQKRRFRQELQGNNSLGKQLNYLSAQASPPLLLSSYGQRQQQQQQQSAQQRKCQSTQRHQSILRDRKSYQDQQNMNCPYGDEVPCNSGSLSRACNQRFYARSNRSEKLSARIEKLTTQNTLQNSNYDTAKSSSRQISFLSRQQQYDQGSGQGYSTLDASQGQVCNLPMKLTFSNKTNKMQINNTLPDWKCTAATIDTAIPEKDITTISRYGLDLQYDPEKYHSQCTQKSDERLTSQGTLETINHNSNNSERTGKLLGIANRSSYHKNISAIGQILRKNRGGTQEFKFTMSNRPQHCQKQGKSSESNNASQINQQVKEEQQKDLDKPFDQDILLLQNDSLDVPRYSFVHETNSLNQMDNSDLSKDDTTHSVLNQPEKSYSPIPRSYTPTQFQQNAKSPLDNTYKPASPSYLSALNSIQGQNRNNSSSNNMSNYNNNSRQYHKKNVSYDVDHAQEKRQQQQQQQHPQQLQQHQVTRFSRAQMTISRQHPKDQQSKKAGLSSEERMEDTCNRSKCSTMVNTNGHWTKGAQLSTSLAKGSYLSTSLAKGSVGSTTIWQTQRNHNKEETDSEHGNMVSENEEDQVMLRKEENIQKNRGDYACILEDSLSCYFKNNGGKGNSRNMESQQSKERDVNDDNGCVSQERVKENAGTLDLQLKQRQQLQEDAEEEKHRIKQIAIDFDMGEVAELIQNNQNERDVISERNESGFSSSQGNNLIEEPLGTDEENYDDNEHGNYGIDSPQLISRGSKCIPTVIQQNRKRRTDVFMEEDTVNLESQQQQQEKEYPQKPIIILEQRLFKRSRITNPLKQSIRYESIPQ